MWIHVTTIHYKLSPSLYNFMNERKKENVHSNEAHLLLLIVVIRTIIMKIGKIIFFYIIIFILSVSAEPMSM